MTNTAWRFVLAVYAAFWFVALAIERHGFSTFLDRVPMTAQDLFLTVPFFWGYAIYALLSGSIHSSSRWRITILERDNNPVGYWISVTFYFLYGVVLIILGLNR